jgi:hypothetical protein
MMEPTPSAIVIGNWNQNKKHKRSKSTKQLDLLCSSLWGLVYDMRRCILGCATKNSNPLPASSFSFRAASIHQSRHAIVNVLPEIAQTTSKR